MKKILGVVTIVACLLAVSVYSAVSVNLYAASYESNQDDAMPVTLYGWNGSTIGKITTDSNNALETVATESAGSWATARTNVVANDTATTYGTADTGNITTTGYKHARFRVFMNATADSMTFACGTATATTNPIYGYTPAVTVSGYSTTAPFICSCDTNGQTTLFPRVTALSASGNVTKIDYQLYN